MGKQTPEEESRSRMLAREKDRERKRMKRMNPEYRRLEQERDRDRKKARRSNETFRQMEKLRDKLRKDRKRGIYDNETALRIEYLSEANRQAEPEIITSDPISGEQSTHMQIQHHPIHLAHPDHHHQHQEAHDTQKRTENCNGSPTSSDISSIPENSISPTAHHNANHPSASLNKANNDLCGSMNNSPVMAHSLGSSGLSSQLPPQLNKGLPLYPPPFPHHHIPLAGVTLMPQLCHPILHQNFGAALYPPSNIKQEYDSAPSSYTNVNGIKQEFEPSSSEDANNTSPNLQHSQSGSPNHLNPDDMDPPLIEPEIILQTSNDVITAPHHFHNHPAAAAVAAAAAHSHHLHPQQRASIFPHMSHLSHMRDHVPPPSLSLPSLIPLPLTTAGQHMPQNGYHHLSQQVEQHRSH